MRMLSFIKALAYRLCHPFEIVTFTVVRRYVDAQGHYIGELYDGSDPDSKMIGASCDSWPLNADTSPLPDNPRVCWRLSFLDPLPVNTLRVGALEPKDNAKVQAYVSMKRFNTMRVSVHNRFVEHVMGMKI